MVRERGLRGKGLSSILGGGFLFSIETLPIIVKYFKNGSDRLRKGTFGTFQNGRNVCYKVEALAMSTSAVFTVCP